MPEESTFRKYACPKLKLSRLLLDNLFRILVQNLPALEELNSKKHTPSPTVWFLRNCGIAQKSSCGIAQNLSFAKAEKGNFARNDFCEWLRKLLFFRAKLMRKERKILRFVPQKLRKSFANGNPIPISLIFHTPWADSSIFMISISWMGTRWWQTSMILLVELLTSLSLEELKTLPEVDKLSWRPD